MNINKVFLSFFIIGFAILALPQLEVLAAIPSTGAATTHYDIVTSLGQDVGDAHLSPGFASGNSTSGTIRTLDGTFAIEDSCVIIKGVKYELKKDGKSPSGYYDFVACGDDGSLWQLINCKWHG